MTVDLPRIRSLYGFSPLLWGAFAMGLLAIALRSAPTWAGGRSHLRLSDGQPAMAHAQALDAPGDGPLTKR